MVSQIVATVIFITMFALIITERFERHLVTLSCGAATLVLVFGACMRSAEEALRVINVKSIFTMDFWYSDGETASAATGINWETILFIAGMMVMVESMAEAGFFKWLCLSIAKAVHYKVIPVFFASMLLAGVLSMFIDSITVILFLAAVTIELARILHFNPVPFVLAEIFCANLGGSATMCGDPPNIIIGTSMGYSFSDFLLNTGLMAGVAMIFIPFFFYFCFRKELKKDSKAVLDPSRFPDPKKMIRNKGAFAINTAIFMLAVVLLITHSMTGLSVAFIGVLVAGLCIIVAGRFSTALLRGVDYKTLLFFIGLFVVVGGLECTGVLEKIAQLIDSISGGHIAIVIVIIIWFSGLASAFVDNIPFAATMIPVIRSLAEIEGFDLSTMAWALAMGTDVGGSATPIGGSANVVGIAAASKEGYHITWGKYCKYMVPASVLALGISTFIMFMRYL